MSNKMEYSKQERIHEILEVVFGVIALGAMVGLFISVVWIMCLVLYRVTSFLLG